MKINSAIIITIVTFIVGFISHQQYLWIPISVLIACLIDLYTRQWVMSDRLGSARNLSALIKFLFAVIGFYAMIGQIICIGLIFWWFI